MLASRIWRATPSAQAALGVTVSRRFPEEIHRACSRADLDKPAGTRAHAATGSPKFAPIRLLGGQFSRSADEPDTMAFWRSPSDALVDIVAGAGAPLVASQGSWRKYSSTALTTASEGGKSDASAL